MSAQQSLQFVMSLNLRATKRLPGRGGGRKKMEGVGGGRGASERARRTLDNHGMTGLVKDT